MDFKKRASFCDDVAGIADEKTLDAAGDTRGDDAPPLFGEVEVAGCGDFAVDGFVRHADGLDVCENDAPRFDFEAFKTRVGHGLPAAALDEVHLADGTDAWLVGGDFRVHWAVVVVRCVVASGFAFLAACEEYGCDCEKYKDDIFKSVHDIFCVFSFLLKRVLLTARVTAADA